MKEDSRRRSKAEEYRRHAFSRYRRSVIAFPQSHYSNYTQYSDINKLTTNSGGNNKNSTANKNANTDTTTSDNKPSYMSHNDLMQVHQ